jgi:hypothetical protein
MDEIVRECSIHNWYEVSENLNGRDHLEDLGINGE